jgi:hypothetical protein
MLRRCFQSYRALRNFQIRHTHYHSIQLETTVTESPSNIYKQRKISKRPLDGLESVFHEYHKTGVGFSYLLTPITSKIPIEEQPIREALTLVSYQQPLLRATITEKSGYKYFECIEGRTSFGFSVLDRDIHDAEKITEEIFAGTKFDSDDGPLWKAVLIPGKFDSSSKSYNGGLALAISHAIANAPSLTIVLKQVLDYLESITKGTAPNLKDIPSLPLYPSYATLLFHTLPTPPTPKATYYNILPSPDYINPVLSQFPTIEDNPERIEPTTKVLIRTIPPDRAVSLLQQCRQNNSTITGAILAACHFAFSGLLKTTQLPSTCTNDVTCLTAVGRNHRPRLPADYVACHFGSLTYDITLPSPTTDFWEVAQSLSQCIRNDISHDKDLEFLSEIENDSESYIKQVLHQGSLKLASRQKSSLTVSNVGQFYAENTPENIFHLQGLIGGTPIHKRFGTFGNYITSLNGAVHYMFCYDGSIISPEIAQRYSDGVWGALKLDETTTSTYS